MVASKPLATQNYNYTQPTSTQQALSGAGGLYNLYNTIFGGSSGSSGIMEGGAAAVSVLTEPSRFDGSLDHLVLASRTRG